MHLSRLPMILLLLAVLGVASPADERILDFRADIRILPDASLVVRETIRVNSEHMKIEHGIFRDFPTIYTDYTGRRHTVAFTVLKVLRDGQEEPYSREPWENGVRVRMGDPNTTITEGEHTYELNYTATRELGFFPDHDELYWNVTGNGWEFPIDSASATVTLPYAVPSGQLKLTGYTGAQGSRESNLRYQQLEDGSEIVFETTTPLSSHQGLTIVVGFPKDLVAEPTNADRWQWFFSDNVHGLVGLAGLAVVLLYYFQVWNLVGRDPKPGTIVVS